MITRLGHIAVRISDINTSLHFYVDILGLEEAFRLYGEDGSLTTVYLYIAPYQFLELFTNGRMAPERRDDTIGPCHICLEVVDIQAAYAQLKEQGAPIDREIRTGKARCLQFWTHDPDGTAIELMQLPPESLQYQATDRFLRRDGGQT